MFRLIQLSQANTLTCKRAKLYKCKILGVSLIEMTSRFLTLLFTILTLFLFLS